MNVTPTTIAADTAPEFALVPFEGTEILAARSGDAVFVPMKRFCGTLGVPWDGQRRRIERNQALREATVMMTVPSSGGHQLQQTLPIEFIPGFLLGVSSDRYKPELRDKILKFQRRCHVVLFNHFFPEGAVLTPAPSVPSTAPLVSPPTATTIVDIRTAAELVDRLRLEPIGPVRTFLQAALDQSCAQLGLEAPLVPMAIPSGPTNAERIDALLLGLRTLDGRGVAYNHLGPDARGRIALNLPQLAGLFARHDIDVQIDDALREALRAGDRRWRCGLQAIPSRLSRRRRLTLCHVLERAIS